MVKENRCRGFIDPLLIPLIVIVICTVTFVGIKIKANGHETACEQAAEDVLEKVIEYEGHQILADKTE